MKKSPSIKLFAGNLFTEALSVPLSVIAGIIIAQLGATEKGIYSFILVFLNIITTALLAGIPGGVKFYISNQQSTIKQSLFTVLTLATFFGLGLSLLFFISWKFGFFLKIGEHFSNNEITLISLFCIPLTLNVFLNKLLEGKSDFKMKNYIYLTHLLLLLSLLLYLVIFKKGTIIIGLSCFGASHAYITLALTFYTAKKYGILFSFDKSYLKKAIRYGIQVWPTEQLTRVTNKYDQIALGLFLPSKFLGVYSVAFGFSDLVNKFSNAIIPIYFNQVASLSSKKTQFMMTQQVLRIVLFFQLIISGVLIITGSYLIPIFYGEAYKESIQLVLILLPSFLFYSFSRIVIQFFSAIQQPLKGSIIRLTGYLVGIPLSIILVLKFNYFGAAISHLISSIVLAIISYLHISSEHRIQLTNILLIKKQDFSTIQSQMVKNYFSS